MGGKFKNGHTATLHTHIPAADRTMASYFTSTSISPILDYENSYQQFRRDVELYKPEPALEKFEWLLSRVLASLQKRERKRKQALAHLALYSMLKSYEDHTRLDGSPAWSHPLMNANIGLWLGDPNADRRLLHDILEDIEDPHMRLVYYERKKLDVESYAEYSDVHPAKERIGRIYGREALAEIESMTRQKGEIYETGYSWRAHRTISGAIDKFGDNTANLWGLPAIKNAELRISMTEKKIRRMQPQIKEIWSRASSFAKNILIYAVVDAVPDYGVKAELERSMREVAEGDLEAFARGWVLAGKREYPEVLERVGPAGSPILHVYYDNGKDASGRAKIEIEFRYVDENAARKLLSSVFGDAAVHADNVSSLLASGLRPHLLIMRFWTNIGELDGKMKRLVQLYDRELGIERLAWADLVRKGPYYAGPIGIPEIRTLENGEGQERSKQQDLFDHLSGKKNSVHVPALKKDQQPVKGEHSSGKNQSEKETEWKPL